MTRTAPLGLCIPENISESPTVRCIVSMSCCCSRSRSLLQCMKSWRCTVGMQIIRKASEMSQGALSFQPWFLLARPHFRNCICLGQIAKRPVCHRHRRRQRSQKTPKNLRKPIQKRLKTSRHLFLGIYSKFLLCWQVIGQVGQMVTHTLKLATSSTSAGDRNSQSPAVWSASRQT